MALLNSRVCVRLIRSLKRYKASCSDEQQTSGVAKASKARLGANYQSFSSAERWMDNEPNDDHRSFSGKYRSRNVNFERVFGAQRRIQRGSSQFDGKRGRSPIIKNDHGKREQWAGTLELPTVDYSKLDLPVVEKNSYKEHPLVEQRTADEVERWIAENEVTLRGSLLPKPIFSFEEAGFPEKIVQKLLSSGFTKPTEIQSVGWPIALTGHDIISISRTGSGKTLAYALPGIIHLQNQSESRETGPTFLVLAPTRELVQQINAMIAPYWRNVCSVYGGAGREGQAKRLSRGVDILVAAPGRLLDFLMTENVNLRKCTYLVVDEADRMLDMGFEPQIRKIISMIRPDRQTLMFSATWPKEVRSLAKDFLINPVFVNVGSLELAANRNINQIVEVVYEEQKPEKLLSFLDKIASEPRCKTLVFVGMKRTADWLMRSLRKQQYSALSLHGDKSQTERNFVMNDFKNGESTILIATDVAARGLDVNDIKYVINYDCPKSGEDYIHRIGRTARHDKKGTSYTLCTPDDSAFARELIEVMKGAKLSPPRELFDVAVGKRSRKVGSIKS